MDKLYYHYNILDQFAVARYVIFGHINDRTCQFRLCLLGTFTSCKTRVNNMPKPVIY